MFPLPITTWIIAGLIALTSLTGWYGYHEHDELVVYKQHIADVAKEQQDKVEQDKKDAKQITENIVSGYTSYLNSVHDHGTSAVRPVPNPAQGTDATVCTRQFIDAANETNVQLEYLKQWVDEQCKLGCEK